MVPLPPLRDGGCALPICPFGRACLPLISDAPDCKCSPGRLRFLGDGHERTVPLRRGNFNPRAPCGARRYVIHLRKDVLKFQSTRPVWGATLAAPSMALVTVFQSTRPVWGATSFLLSRCGSVVFQSTRPVWGATSAVPVQTRLRGFQSTRPVWGATALASAPRLGPSNFNPRAPCGARHGRDDALVNNILFQSTRPVWGATRPL